MRAVQVWRQAPLQESRKSTGMICFAKATSASEPKFMEKVVEVFGRKAGTLTAMESRFLTCFFEWVTMLTRTTHRGVEQR